MRKAEERFDLFGHRRQAAEQSRTKPTEGVQHGSAGRQDGLAITLGEGLRKQKLRKSKLAFRVLEGVSCLRQLELQVANLLR